jgi:uncharacterized protein YggE
LNQIVRRRAEESAEHLIRHVGLSYFEVAKDRHVGIDGLPINVGAEASASTESGAKAEVDAQMAAITAALQEAGVAAKDIQTSHHGIHYEREPMPMLRDGPSAEIQEAYVVSNMARVTVRDVEKAGAVLDAVVQAGVNQVYGVTFTVSDESTWQSQARASAMANARSRAQELADLAGVELGQILSVSEVIDGVQVPVAFEHVAQVTSSHAGASLSLKGRLQPER